MIYFLADLSPMEGHRVKIGYSGTSTGVLKRYEQHRSSNTRIRFYCAIDGDRMHEKALHSHFEFCRVPGEREWFYLSNDLQRYLEWLGEQPWVACKEDEVISPFGHYTVDVMWPYQDSYLMHANVGQLPLLTDTIMGLRWPWSEYDRVAGTVRDSNDYYTPQRFVDSARAVMGSIDLDPASHPIANRIVRATKIYTAQQNGLSSSNPWSGNVWLNPPYGGKQTPFIQRVIHEYENRNIEQAVVCVNGYRYDTRWFRPLWDYTLCFASSRIAFVGGPKGDDLEGEQSPTNGTIFVYLGERRERFVEEFVQHGHVAWGVAVSRQLSDLVLEV